MRFAVSAFLLGLSCAGAPAVAQVAEPDTYVFDVLALQPCKGNFARLVKGEEVPDWVKAIALQGAGTAGPGRTVDVNGTPYRLDRVCKVDACAGNTIDILWAPRGAKVWGALVEGGAAPVMLGAPGGAQRKALEAAVSGSDPALAPPAMAASPSSGAAPASAASAPARASAASLAEPSDYIFDVLAVPPYKGNFARLVKGQAAPGWVKAISTQGAGTAGPGRTVQVDGAPYRLDRVCKVGSSCATDRIDVLWAPHGAKVWAALVEGGKPTVVLGSPKGDQAKALAEASGRVSTPAPPN